MVESSNCLEIRHGTSLLEGNYENTYWCQNLFITLRSKVTPEVSMDYNKVS